MKTVEQLAREAWQLEFIPESDTPKLQRFAEIVIAQYRESLLAGVGEPHYWTQRIADDTVNMVPFYYPDQLAAAVLRERDAMRAELAGAEAVNKAAALEIVSLRAELAAAKADAEQYKFLLTNCGFGIRRNGVVELSISLYPKSPDHISELPAAIAAAMKGQPT